MPQYDLDTGDELYHYGVKGMKWGVRRARDWANDGRVKKQAARREKFEKKFHEAGDQRMKNLSNAEIKAKVERLNLEKQYKQLAAENQPKGKKMVGKILMQQGEQTVKQMVNQEIQKKMRANA